VGWVVHWKKAVFPTNGRPLLLAAIALTEPIHVPKLTVMEVKTIYTANAFAWGFSSGEPTPRVRLFSRIVAAAWNGLWFYFVYRLAL